MQLEETEIPEVLLFHPTVFEDDRGFFLESYRSSWLPRVEFVQDNHSRSTQNTLRGLHYQLNNPQGKLVRVTQGAVFDVAVDMRRSSPTFGRWVGRLLSAENKQIFWVPPGFAHGFCVVSETAEFQYKCTNYYDPEDEISLKWDDVDIGIDWPIDTPLLSDRDNNAKPLNKVPYYD